LSPFFTLSQNPLADNTYLEYLEMMYGSKLYIPTTNDSQACFDEYSDDARRRFDHDTQFPTEPKQIKPGEHVEMAEGKFNVSGQGAVMAVNGLIAKVIFNKNPDREFYIEQSFPLDWMYPYLEPHGIILKINRQSLPKITAETVQRDQDYWSGLFSGMVGDWLKTNTPLRAVADFVEAVRIRKDLSSFHGDPRFIANDDAMRLFSKQRANIGDLYKWRMANTADPAEWERMANAARFAYAQAWAICPYSPEAVFGLVRVLKPEVTHDPMAEFHRLAHGLKSPGDKDDALLVAETADRVATQMGQPNAQLSDLAERLRKE
jgi:hypothetical protein